MSGYVRCACCQLPIPITADDIGLTVNCPRTRKLVPVRDTDMHKGTLPVPSTLPSPAADVRKPTPPSPSVPKLPPLPRLPITVPAVEPALLTPRPQPVIEPAQKDSKPEDLFEPRANAPSVKGGVWVLAGLVGAVAIGLALVGLSINQSGLPVPELGVSRAEPATRQVEPESMSLPAALPPQSPVIAPTQPDHTAPPLVAPARAPETIRPPRAIAELAGAPAAPVPETSPNTRVVAVPPASAVPTVTHLELAPPPHDPLVPAPPAVTTGLLVRPTKPIGKLEVVMKRRNLATDEDLRKQLQFAPETGFDQMTVQTIYVPLDGMGSNVRGGRNVRAGAELRNVDPDLGPKTFATLAVQANRPDMVALPWIRGVDCELGNEHAQRLHVLSTHFRDALRNSVKKGDVRPDPDKLRTLLSDNEWRSPQALPAITQIMQVEHTPVRALMVELLGQMKGREASIALAQRALFDLSPEIRERAVRELAERPAEEYLPVIAGGFRYPLAAVSDHAAETVVALQRTELVPDLVQMLNEPNPLLPFKKDKKYLIQEVVRINHLCNCMLCHAPSESKEDLVRGRVPQPGEDPPPLYYQERTGLFVRADRTYIRQDFSVVQPVANPGKWAGQQRYDYLLRTRQVTKTEQTTYQKTVKENKLPADPQQAALRQLTGKDYGKTYDEWFAGLQKAAQPRPQMPAAQTPAQQLPTGQKAGDSAQPVPQFQQKGSEPSQQLPAKVGERLPQPSGLPQTPVQPVKDPPGSTTEGRNGTGRM